MDVGETPGGYEDFTPGMGGDEEFYGYEEFNPDNMSPEEIEDLLKPFSTKMKRAIFYDNKLKRYHLSEKDEEILRNYFEINKFYEYQFEIIQNKNLRPFDKKLPLCTRFLLRVILPVVATVIYSYACLMLLQLALFNVILMGIMVIGLSKIWHFLNKFSFKYEYNYRTKDFKKHIEKANDEYFRAKGVVLVGGEEGKWLELQLPDTEDKYQNTEVAGMRPLSTATPG